MLATPELEIARKLPPEGCSSAEAERYTRWLATHHYENFNVVSWLLPRRLHQDFYNVYAYCRWSDDLGDEVADPRRALELLDAWEDELRRIDGHERGPAHPVLIALAGTIRAKNIPIEPFRNLLRAFRQDQTVHRYATWDDVLGYCEYSANPVGRLVLYLCDYGDEERQRLSDFTCTALQLANFWQDVSRDLEKGRIYIPLDALAEHGLGEADIVARRFDARYVALMKSLIERTRELFQSGLPLAGRVEPFLRVDLEMFSRGGIAVLDAIEASGYNTLEHRPALTKWTQTRLLVRALAALSLEAESGQRNHSTSVARGIVDKRRKEVTAARSKSFIDSRAIGERSRFVCGVQPDRSRRSQQFLSGFLRSSQREAQCAVCALCLHAAGGRRLGRAGRSRFEAAGASTLAGDAGRGRGGPHRRPRDSAGDCGHDFALRDSDAPFSRSDSRRGNGFDGRLLRDI